MQQIVETVDTNVKFDKATEPDVVSHITKLWDRWDDDRQAQLDIIEKMEDLLDVENYDTEEIETSFNEEKETEKRDLIKDSDIVQLYNSAVAHTYNNTFKNISQSLSIELENQLNDAEMAQVAYLQKASLLEVWKKARGRVHARQVVRNWYAKGEMIFYVNWKQIFQNVRRKVGFNMMGIDLRQWVVQRVLKYDGANIKCIEPEDFVFDVARIDDFDNAPKIYRTWATFQDIKDNEEYKQYLSKKDLYDLEQMVKNAEAKDQSAEDAEEEDRSDKSNRDDMINILEYCGDITIKGKYYRNMKVVIIGRKFVGCFEYNPNIISPFVFSAARIHRETKRGVPALSFVIPLTEATSDTINKINKAIGLSVNKCYLAPKGAFLEKPVVTENGIIEYDDAKLLSGSGIVPLDFTSGIPIAIQYLQYLEGKKEQAFGMYKYATGDAPDRKNTATEAKITAAGQAATLSFENDIINTDIIVPLFEKIGEMQANFQDEPQQIRYKDQFGKESVGIVDDTVRQGNYTYTLSDMSTTMEKQANAEQFLQALKQVAELAMSQGKIINITEVLNTIGAIYQIENPTKFIQDMGGMNEQAGIAPALPVDPTTGMAGVAPALPEGDIQQNIA